MIFSGLPALNFPTTISCSSVPAAAVRAASADKNLTLLGINTAGGDASKGDFGLGAIPGREAEFQAAVDQSIASCRGSGATTIHCMADVVPETQPQQAKGVFVAHLGIAAVKAAAHDLDLLLEPINLREKPGYFYSTLAPAAGIMDLVAAPILGSSLIPTILA